jgi:eukaryotic-like serine/threonine-protein kinase
MTPSPTRDVSLLAPIARAYLQQASALDIETLTQNQDGPWTNIAFGAAGVAYALWRAAGPGRRRRLEQADRLLREAAAAAPNDRWSDAGSAPRGGLYYGPGGIGYVRLLVAGARRDLTTYEQELERFLATCRAFEGPSELLAGAAGLLNGARLLHAHANDGRITEVAEILSAKLNRRATDDTGGWATWTGTTAQGFAHGAAGILHSLLCWSQAAGREPRPETLRALAAFAKHATTRRSAAAARGALPRVLERSWCNGSAGHLLLWTRAYETTGRKEYLELARASARSMLTPVRGAPGDLCCGIGGRAFALLAMDRIEPRGGWYGRALQLAHRAMQAAEAAIGAWPNGLFKGYPGLVCLLADLQAPSRERKGFPLIEG